MAKEKQQPIEDPQVEAWGFTPEEIENQGDVSTPYFTRLGRYIKTNLNKFELVDAATNKVIDVYDKLTVAIAYSHTAAKLLQGLYDGSAAGKDSEEWTDAEKTVLALCYDRPTKSQYPGMFAAYGDALKRDGVVKYRNWLWLYMPDRNEYAVLTVGPSSIGSFQAMASAYKASVNPVISAWLTEITLESAVGPKNKNYFRPTFRATGKPSAANKAEWTALIGDFATKCRVEHQDQLVTMHRDALRKLAAGVDMPAIGAPAPAQLTAPTLGTEHKQADPFAEAPPV